MERQDKQYKLLQKGDGSLMIRKLHELFPITLLNRVSIMIMLSVDSIVVGWRTGEEAVASVNYLQPFNFVIGALVALISTGIATMMSKQLGSNNPKDLEHKKKAIIYSTILLSFILSVIQIPICFFIFRLYDMGEAVHAMARRYAYASMLATPFSIMNTIGTYLLTSVGCVKIILYASLLQSGMNVIMDIIFVFVFDMSTYGAGLGTLAGTVAYWIYVFNHLRRHTEFLKFDQNAECRQEMLDIIKYGTPSMMNSFAEAGFGILIFWFISRRLSDSGIAIHSVCLFAASFVTVISLSLRFAMQSLTGMLSTIGDYDGMHRLLKHAMIICLSLCGVIMLVAEFFPALFFKAYGFEISAAGAAALRVYALHFIFMGANGLLQLYFNSWNDTRFSMIHILLSSIILPSIFSAIFFMYGAPWTIWLCYGLSDIICFAIGYIRYVRKYHAERRRAAPNEFNIITHPDEASYAAEGLENILLENGISHSLANRIALCVEEIGAYAKPVKENARVNIQVYACVYADEADIIILDDGQCVAFPDRTDHDSILVTDNYEMLKRIASECNYDYVLNLNRFTVKLRS